MSYDFHVDIEETPFAGEGFKISREIKTVATTVKLTISQDGLTGIGECVPLKRYNYTAEGVADELRTICASYPTLDNLEKIKAGPARFALDTALTELNVAKAGQTVADYLGISHNTPIATAFTLSLDTPEKMALEAAKRTEFATLKLKIGNDGLNIERLLAIQSIAPKSNFILDANEALTPQTLEQLLIDLAPFPVVLMEQPLPAGQDEALLGFQSSIPFAADESCHTVDSIDDMIGKYQVANIKLDKTGGYHHALKLAQAAQDKGLEIMIGCMGSTSLSIYPAVLLAQKIGAKYNDLDGALLLAEDPYKRVAYKNGTVVLV